MMRYSKIGGIQQIPPVTPAEAIRPEEVEEYVCVDGDEGLVKRQVRKQVVGGVVRQTAVKRVPLALVAFKKSISSRVPDPQSLP
jgi:hypothetical protein